MEDKNNPYGVLGLSPGAGDEEVTRAYRRLAKKYHPDLNPGDERAEKRMAEINEAYEAIKSKSAVNEDLHEYGTELSAEDEAAEYINAGLYSEALNILSSTEERSARWYYLGAAAHSQLGNTVNALRLIEQAVRLEPSNQLYREAMESLKKGGKAYSGQAEKYGSSPLKSKRFAACCILFTVLNISASFCFGYGSYFKKHYGTQDSSYTETADSSEETADKQENKSES